jgi:hypothetical protein
VLLLGIAVVLASMLAFGGGDTGTTPRTPLALPPSASTTTETLTPSTTTPSTTTSTTPPTTTSSASAGLAGMTGMDGQGFVGHTTRCADGTVVAAIQTSQSMAVICETSPGTYQYRGERLRDGANLQLSNATPNGGGFDVTNPADGARYEIRPDRLRILSNGGVDSDEPAVQYGTR